MKCDGSLEDVLQMSKKMLQTLGIAFQEVDAEMEAQEIADEATLWKRMFEDVNDSRLKITMETHVHAISDEDINESDLSSLPLEVLDWLKLNREQEDDEMKEAVEPVEPVEKNFHFARIDSDKRNC